MQATTSPNLPPRIQKLLPELLQLDSAQRLSLIRLLATDSSNKHLLKQAIQSGLYSPLVENFDFEQHLASLQDNADNG